MAGAVVSKRRFTVSEANALIPRLEIIIERLQRQARTLREAAQELAASSGEPTDVLDTERLLSLRPALRPVIEDVDSLLEEIHTCGGHFKGLDLGLVDFPAEVDGELVLLCWQYGEKEIGFYHTVDGGFAGRRALDPTAAADLRYLQ
jgi:hypothetical protein